MKEQLQEVLVTMLDKTQAGISTIVDTLMVEAPELVREILVYNFVVSFAWFVLLLGIVIAMAIPTKRIWVWCIKYTSDNDEPACILSILYSAIHILIIFGYIGSITWLQIWLAPRLYLLEYITALVK
jgi:hypothetical protein